MEPRSPVSLETLGLQFDLTVYFTEHHDYRRNVLGPQGWIQQIRLGLVDYDGSLYISKYDDGLHSRVEP